MLKKYFFDTPHYFHSADSLKKDFWDSSILESSVFRWQHGEIARHFFLHSNAAREVQNMVQFA